MRGFRCVPLRLKHDLVFAGLTSFERDVVYSALVAQDDRHCLPFSEAGLRSEIFPERPFVALREIANARDRLVALGVFTHKRGAKRDWLEIAEHYRHSEGNVETSFGENPATFSQGELPLPPHVVPKINGSRAEKNRANNESARKSPPKVGPPAPPKQLKESGNRDAGAGKESGNRFARDEGAFPNDDRWGRFIGCIGLVEAVSHGALWESRWKHDADTLWACASDWLANQQTGNFGAVATAAFAKKWPGFGRAA